MTDNTLRAIGEILDAVPQAGAFATQRSGSAEHLALTVRGVGRLEFPVPPDQARQLCEVAHPAHYGLREQTLLDPNVRDTWEVPRDLLTIDEDRWRATLLPLLDTLRTDLGLPPDSELSAQLHSMLVYEPGQFFQRHQDSEKAAGMIGTLVVSLPSAFTGGELVIEQQGAQVVDTGSPERLSFVAFYSDCAHEVRPVTEGFRIALTYNLIATECSSPDFARHPSAALMAEQLRAHFDTPVESADSYPRSAPRPPRQLVYLMDHQYSQSGFGWDRLKGRDATRTGMLLAAADLAGCDTSLALAEAEECYEEDDYTTSMLIYRQRWERVADGWKCVESSEVDFDDEGEMIDPVSEDPADLPLRSDLPLAPDSDELGGLRWSDLTLTWLIDRSGAAGKPEMARVPAEELCTGATKSPLEPFASELEGYMGNEGNNANFWYRRAAIVVRPRR
ncbi:2OG-Fe(II) oxygenase [Nocardia sp. NPDC048505]|uniref:2OG-Fe(II) oxygenase n=1 Tax=unclassified Nocardia TaxID=2637762 RepID=UPI0033FB2535